MRPILMKGHERPLTFLKYNRDGDLLFSCAKDHTPTVWFADNGERLGTYRGHNGAVWCCDVSRDSMMLITGSADQSAKLWNVQTGAQLFTFNFDSPARAVDFVVGDKLAVITTDPFMGLPSAIHIKRIARDPSEQTGESLLTIKGPQGRINRAVWEPLNKTIISAGEDAVVRIWDSETGKLLKESDKETGHKKTITSLTKSADSSHFLTGSLEPSMRPWINRSVTQGGRTTCSSLKFRAPGPSMIQQIFSLSMAALFRIGKGEPPPIPNSLSGDAQDFIFRCLKVYPNYRPTAAELLNHPFVKRPLSTFLSPASPYYNGTRA